MSHTPAPWRYDFVDGYCGELLAASGQVIATFVDEPSVEDARLIALAPELLDCLRHTVRFWDQLNAHDIDNMRALIARATGETA